MNAYKAQKHKPEIEVTDNAFKVTLPNVNYYSQHSDQQYGTPVNNRNGDKENVIVQYLKEHGKANRSDIEKLLGISTSTAFRQLKQLIQNGTVHQEGQGKNTIYLLS